MGRNGRILLMDDEEFIREVAVEMLDFIGYEVDACCNGVEAITLFRTARENDRPYSAVILDLTIPGGMGGKEAAIHMLHIDPTAILVVSSGYSNDPVVADYKRHGFSGMIIKPFGIKAMADELHRLLPDAEIPSM